MHRLKRKGFIGNINLNDISFQDERHEIKVTLTNTDKSLNKDTWDSVFRYDMPNNQVGYITFFPKWESADNAQNVLYNIKINLLEVDPAYKQTRVLMYLLRHFQETIIQPAIDEYGVERVCISADVIHEKLKETLNRIMENGSNIHVPILNDNEVKEYANKVFQKLAPEELEDIKEQNLSVETPNTAEEYAAPIFAALDEHGGFNITDMGRTRVVYNPNMRELVSIVYGVIPNAAIYGEIDLNGDIYVAFYTIATIQDECMSFMVFDENIILVSNPQDNQFAEIARRLQNNLSSITNTLQTYLEGFNIMFKWSENYTTDEFIKKLEEAASGDPEQITATRLKYKTIHKGMLKKYY